MSRKDKDAPQKTPEQEALEKHVDAMMDPKKPDPKPAAAAKKPEITAVAIPAEDGPGTAPQLSPKLRKQVTIDGADKPLSIDKLDELITKAEKPKKAKKAAAKAEPEAKPEPPAGQSEELPENSSLDDEQTDKAVDDIVAYEGDVVLAVADSTADQHNKEVAAGAKPHGHPILRTLIWTLITLAVLLIIALGALLLMGDSLTSKLGL
jgi:hypothetical protein